MHWKMTENIAGVEQHDWTMNDWNLADWKMMDWKITDCTNTVIRCLEYIVVTASVLLQN